MRLFNKLCLRAANVSDSNAFSVETIRTICMCDSVHDEWRKPGGPRFQFLICVVASGFARSQKSCIHGVSMHFSAAEKLLGGVLKFLFFSGDAEKFDVGNKTVTTLQILHVVYRFPCNRRRMPSCFCQRFFSRRTQHRRLDANRIHAEASRHVTKTAPSQHSGITETVGTWFATPEYRTLASHYAKYHHHAETAATLKTATAPCLESWPTANWVLSTCYTGLPSHDLAKQTSKYFYSAHVTESCRRTP